jgi:quinone-modifying oxidoreductase, subunit QmoC
MMVLFGFIGLFVVTNIFFVALYVFGQHGPYSQLNPVKWLGNRPASPWLWAAFDDRPALWARTQQTSYKDWWLLGLVLGLGLTGMLAQMTRLGGLAAPSYFIYFPAPDVRMGAVCLHPLLQAGPLGLSHGGHGLSGVFRPQVGAFRL